MDTTSGIQNLPERFAARLTAQLVEQDQGHDRLEDHGITLEAAWFHSDDRTWELWIEAETEAKQAKTPDGTKLEAGGAEDSDAVRVLISGELERILRELISEL